LRQGLLDDGELFVFGGELRGSAATDAKQKENTKMTEGILVDITKFVDDCHSIGKAVVARDIRAMLFEKHGMNVHRTTVGRAVKKLGLSYSPIGRAKRTYASYRVQAIKDYLISLDGYYKKMMEAVVPSNRSNC